MPKSQRTIQDDDDIHESYRSPYIYLSPHCFLHGRYISGPPKSGLGLLCHPAADWIILLFTLQACLGFVYHRIPSSTYIVPAIPSHSHHSRSLAIRGFPLFYFVPVSLCFFCRSPLYQYMVSMICCIGVWADLIACFRLRIPRYHRWKTRGSYGGRAYWGAASSTPTCCGRLLDWSARPG